MLINSLKILDIVCIIEDIKNIQRYKKKTFKKMDNHQFVPRKSFVSYYKKQKFYLL